MPFSIARQALRSGREEVGTAMADGYELDPDELTAAGSSLRSVVDVLTGASGTVKVSPDGGSSSDEIRDAFASFASAISGLGSALQAAADGLDGTVSTYRSSDTRVTETFGAGAGR
jgi:hypothetical protein